jgi:mannose-6-phosphate isomerase-like protein (cupin superfamily)
MPEIVGTSQIDVDDGAGLTIKQLIGNIASKDDRISIAHINIAKPTSQPWLTIDYDEYLCVLSGRIILQHAGGELQVSAEQAVIIRRGGRFRPTFPGKYIWKTRL